MGENSELIQKIKDIAGWTVNPMRFELFTDTSDWMNIHRGHVIRIGGKDYAVRGNMRETRFGISDQPKYWVFEVIDLQDGSKKIIKTVFYEEFTAHVGIFKIRCYRKPDKESEVMELTEHDHRFMKGKTCLDDKGNNVRVIDFIKGKTLFNYIPSIPKPHEQYFYEDLPEILWNLYDSIKAIEFLHENELCHGDIRTDHIIIDKDSGKYKWIDFDLQQDVSDFDMWSIGNIISYAAGKGIVAFDSILKNNKIDPQIKKSLTPEDASAFFEYRLMNLKKLYPYIPESISNILLHFTIKPKSYYSNIFDFSADYFDMLEKDFPVK